jgi:hypothetical protein
MQNPGAKVTVVHDPGKRVNHNILFSNKKAYRQLTQNAGCSAGRALQILT